MANVLGAPLRSTRSDSSERQLKSFERQILEHELEMKRIKEERKRERSLKAKARHALGAVKGVVSAVRACGSRIAFRYRNRAPYPRQCSAPAAVFVTEPLQPLSAASAEQLDAMMKNLESEEQELMEKLRELWQHLAVGSHLQPAFVDPDRLAHVTHLLLEGNTEAVERDPDNDEASGAATMRLTSVRLEAALREVHEQMQAVCEQRRRRKERPDELLHATASASALAAPGCAAAALVPSAGASAAGARMLKRPAAAFGSPFGARSPRDSRATALWRRSTSFLRSTTHSSGGGSSPLHDSLVVDGWCRQHRRRAAGGPWKSQPNVLAAAEGPAAGEAARQAAAVDMELPSLPCSKPAEDGDASLGYCVVRVDCRDTTMCDC